MESLDFNYKLKIEGEEVEFPLSVRIEGDWVKIDCPETGFNYGKLPLAPFIACKSFICPWDYADIYKKQKDKSDLEYCKDILMSGTYNEDIRYILSSPISQDYRITSSLNVDMPEITRVVINGDLSRFNNGFKLDLNSLGIGDRILFPSSSYVRISVVLYKEDGSSFPYTFLLNGVNIIMEIVNYNIHLKDSDKLPLSKTLLAQYYVDLSNKIGDIEDSLSKKLDAEKGEYKASDFIESLYSYWDKGVVPVSKNIIVYKNNLKIFLPKSK